MRRTYPPEIRYGPEATSNPSSNGSKKFLDSVVDRPLSVPAIEVHKVCFEYPNLRALDQVSFKIERGSITALVGPNGAGKSTLFRCIASLESPLSGQILINGVDVQESPRQVHRQMGFLSDKFGLYEELSVQRCFTFAAEANGLKGPDVATAVFETARKVGLQDRMSQLTRALSRGLRQRVAIGQAIIHQPKVVILDEPASGLDPEARHELSQLFQRLQREGMTLLVSSHILAELEEYSTHMLVMRGGKIIEHKNLAGSNLDSQTFEMILIEPHENLEQKLTRLPEVLNFSIELNRVRFEFKGDLMARHKLLRRLLEENIPICGLEVVQMNMQDHYLSSFNSKSK